MRPPNAPKAKLGLFDRLSVKLLVLFAATFLIAFLALWAYGISTSYLESTLAEATMPKASQPVVIDQNLRNELSQVMSSTATAEQAAIKDPFNDRTGIVGLNAAQRAVGGTVTTSGGSGTTTAGGPSTTIPGTNRPSGSPNVNAGPAEPLVSASEATKLRWAAWLRRAETGEIPLDPGIFAIDDLLPVGVVDGGNGQQEVLFYSEAVARTFSFPKGTQFYDGWLSEVAPEGVVFVSSHDRRARLRSWTRSLRSVG